MFNNFIEREQMNVYYPSKEHGQYVVVKQNLFVLWKIHNISDFFKHLKKCYFSKKKCQQFCDWENAPDVDFGGILQLKF